MKGIKRILSVLLAILILVGTVLPNRVYAQTISSQTENSDAQKVMEAELQFYFEKVGHFDNDGKYYIDNVALLRDRAQSGNEYALALLSAYSERMEKSPIDFGKCILIDYFGVYIDLIQGNLWDSFVGYIQGKAWEKAAGVVLKILGKSASKANIVATAAQIALAAYNCRGKL